MPRAGPLWNGMGNPREECPHEWGHGNLKGPERPLHGLGFRREEQVGGRERDSRVVRVAGGRSGERRVQCHGRTPWWNSFAVENCQWHLRTVAAGTCASGPAEPIVADGSAQPGPTKSPAPQPVIRTAGFPGPEGPLLRIGVQFTWRGRHGSDVSEGVPRKFGWPYTCLGRVSVGQDALFADQPMESWPCGPRTGRVARIRLNARR
jgi:hypothetical protein